LWELEWEQTRLSCSVYRSETGLLMRVESAGGVIVAEPFQIQPRALARANRLRDNLKRRGWKDRG
jgi:hypothetical protein